MTALGVISEDVREIYAREVEACYHEAGEAARGPKFLDCLQRHVRSQQDALEAIYDARSSDPLHKLATRMKLFRIAS